MKKEAEKEEKFADIALFFTHIKIYTEQLHQIIFLFCDTYKTKSLERKYKLMALLAQQREQSVRSRKENEPRTATRSGITSHNTFDRGESWERLRYVPHYGLTAHR